MYLENYTIKDNIISFPYSNMQLLSEIKNISYKHILLVYEKSINVIILHESCNIILERYEIKFSNCKSAMIKGPLYNYDKIIKMWKDIDVLESLVEINIQQENAIIVGNLYVIINYDSGTFIFNNPFKNTTFLDIELNKDELIIFDLTFPNISNILC